MRAAAWALALAVGAASTAGLAGVEPAAFGGFEVWSAYAQEFTRLAVYVNGTGPAEVAVGVLVRGPLGFSDGAVYTSFTSGEHRVFVQSEDIDLRLGQAAPREHRVFVAPLLPGPGTSSVLVFTAAHEPWSPTVEVAPVGPNATLTPYASGDDVVFARERDFAADERTEVRVDPLVWVHRLENGSVERSFDHGFLGLFAGLSTTGELRMGYEDPEGSHGGKVHWATEGPPGPYRFRIDHQLDASVAGCGPCAPPVVVLAGADAPLPEVWTQG